MDQRVKFIADWLSNDYSKIELCVAYGISRPAADKWIKRYQQGGVTIKGLRNALTRRTVIPMRRPNKFVRLLLRLNSTARAGVRSKVLDYLREKNLSGAGHLRPRLSFRLFFYSRDHGLNQFW